MREEFPDSFLRVARFAPGERISMALFIHAQPVAMNFVCEDECNEAFAIDPERLTPLDRFVRNWVEVVRVRLNDRKSLQDVRRRVESMESALTTVN